MSQYRSNLYKPEFKINSSGQLIGWGGVVIYGFQIEWIFEDEFWNMVDQDKLNEAVKQLNYITK